MNEVGKGFGGDAVISRSGATLCLSRMEACA
jgi:hypothetical protein